MEESIKLLEALYNRIKTEKWKDNMGKLGVLTGVKMSIMKLKIEAAKKGLTWR